MEVSGDDGFGDAGGDALAVGGDLVGCEFRGLVVDATGFGHGDALGLAFPDGGSFQLCHRPQDGEHELARGSPC